MTAKEKNKLAGIFLLIHGGLSALMYLMTLVIFAAIIGSDPHAPKAILGFISVFILVVGAVFALPQIIGGWKMLKEQPNAKNWGVAGSIIACLNAPLGTAAGVFALIFLFSDEGKYFYNALPHKNYLDSANQVDEFRFQDFQYREPHNWK